ncbi:MAG: peptide chain release factor I [Elusimicrobia bacterium]|nr:MAG: peptide chain release factor I [Elusimicrobiota bacterium]
MAVDPSILKRLALLGVDPEDISESFTRSGGKGGQNVNKVSTGVVLSYPPANLIVRCAETRSQARNRDLAWERFAAALETRQAEKRAARRSEIQKEIRRKRPKPRRVKERILETKRRRSATKKLRGRVRRDD